MYVIVRISDEGFVFLQNGRLVHKESVYLHENQENPWFDNRPAPEVFKRLQDAKEEWAMGKDISEVILGLTKEGAGERFWMSKQQQNTLVPRLKRFSGCYGLWPIFTLNP